MVRNPELFSAQMVVEKFNLTRGMDVATVESVMSGGLRELISEGVGKVLWDDGQYGLLMFPKIIPSFPYESMLTLLPHEGYPVRSMISHLTNTQRNQLMTLAWNVKEAVETVALEDGFTRELTYIFQHVGPEDVFPKEPYNTSYLPLHLHIQTVTSLAPFVSFSPITSGWDENQENKHIYQDPAANLLLSCISSNESKPYVTETGAICFNVSRPADKTFQEPELDRFRNIVDEWSGWWLLIAECFTDFQIDDRGRYHPFPREKRLAGVNNLLDTYQGYFSAKNRRWLINLADKLQPANVNPWQWFYKGVNGALGVEFDYKEGIRRWLVSPRIYTSWFRHGMMVKYPTIVRKNKMMERVDEVTARELLPIQRRIVDLI